MTIERGQRIELFFVTHCTAPNCGYEFGKSDERHFIKVLRVIRHAGLGVKKAFWGAVLCEDCFGKAKGLLAGCTHDFGLGEQLAEVFIDETDISRPAFSVFCQACFKKVEKELDTYLLPWSSFFETLKFSIQPPPGFSKLQKKRVPKLRRWGFN